MIVAAVFSSTLLFSLVSKCLGETTVSVSSTASHPVPTTLFGQMFEDISYSGDGGLYAEMLQNRAFQQVTPNTTAALYAWASVGDASLTVISDSSPVSSSLPNSLQVVLSGNDSAGFGNAGYFGIKVDSSWTYSASFYYKVSSASRFTGNATVALQSSSGSVFASASVPISGAQTHWTQVNATLTPTSTPSSLANNFTVTLSGASGMTVNFAMFSLMPPTFMDRPNGMRVDIAETLASMGPAFFRLPGGNNLEGQTVATRWQWNATVGSLLDRPGRVGDWGYINTDGLGLMEYLQWCEDLSMEPIMAVWSGYSLGGTSLDEDQLAPYIQQAIDQINFVVGDPAASDAAALRASLGHPDPFTLNYVEVGNEDFASDTYPYRWRDFAGNISAAFPNITLIATSNVNNPALTPNPKSWDVHVYQTPSWFSSNASYYDSFARDGTTYFEGEYAVRKDADGHGLSFPIMLGSASEAAFMTGLERNSDIVFAASYAPLLGSVVVHEWTPNLVNFDAGAVYPSTSFYVQKLFSLNRGDSYIPSTLPDSNGTLFWSVTQNTADQELIIKIANVASSAQNITFELPFDTVSTSGTAQVLTGPATASNDNATPNAVVPKNSTIDTGATFTYLAPAISVNVLTFAAH